MELLGVIDLQNPECIKRITQNQLCYAGKSPTVYSWQNKICTEKRKEKKKYNGSNMTAIGGNQNVSQILSKLLHFWIMSNFKPF